MKCGRCQADNKEGSKFCAKCGATLSAPPPHTHTTSSAPTRTTTSIAEGEKACPKCNKVLKQNAKFCSGCGYNFLHAAAPEEPLIQPEPNLVRPSIKPLPSEQAEDTVQQKPIPIETKPCPNCGKELKTDAKFCGGCGYSFQQEASATEAAPVQLDVEPVCPAIEPILPGEVMGAAESESIREVVRPKSPYNTLDFDQSVKKRPPIAVFGGIAAATAILIGGGAFYFQSHHNSKQESQPKEIQKSSPSPSAEPAAAPAPAAPTPTAASAVAPTAQSMSPPSQNVPESKLESKKKPHLPKKEETNADRKLLNEIDQYMDQKTQGK